MRHMETNGFWEKALRCLLGSETLKVAGTERQQEADAAATRTKIGDTLY